MTQAILFGAIGTIAETSELQRQAFNRAFAEAGLAWEWSPEVYAGLLKRPGGRSRIEDQARRQGIDVTAPALHARKTLIFGELLAKGIPPRPGVAATLAAACRNGIRTAFVTTTSRDNVTAILAATGLDERMFDFIGNRDMVDEPKPAPEIYERALKALGIAPDQAVAIEDSPESAASARAAGIPVVAFPGAMHAAPNFGEVLLKTDTLDPGTLGLSEPFAPANVRKARVA